MKNRKNMKKFIALLFAVTLLSALSLPVWAAGEEETVTTVSAEGQTQAVEEVQETQEDSTGSKALAVGLAIGLAAAGGAVGMGLVGSKSADGISRQPEAEGKIRTTLMLTMVFIETAIIYALLVVILVIFVL